MTRMQLKVGMALYILLMSIDPKEQGGKRGRKAISKGIKKKLAIFAHEDSRKDEYNKCLAEVDSDLKCAKDNLVQRAGREAMLVNPAALIKTLQYRYADFIDVYELSDSHIQNMADYYDQSSLGFNSMKYANELIKQLSWESEDDKIQTV